MGGRRRALPVDGCRRDPTLMGSGIASRARTRLEHAAPSTPQFSWLPSGTRDVVPSSNDPPIAMHRIARCILAALPFACTSLLCGCVIVNADNHTKYEGRYVSDETLAQIQPG